MSCLFNSIPLKILYPWFLQSQASEVGLSCGLLSLAGKAQSAGVLFFAQKELAFTHKMGLKKAFDFARGKLVLTL